ncbi:MAG: hypothetical protein K6E21_00935 [Bacilli bacterium]|nr:hypothetical protein [Bacilli bacterium]
MKISNFIKWQIKKWLPLLIVVFIFMFTILSLDGKGVLFSSDTIWIYSLLCFILPIQVVSDRFEKGAADAYRAFPANDKQIRRNKILIMLISFLIICTIVYLLSTLVYVTTYGDSTAVSQYGYRDYDIHGMIEEGPTSFLLCYALMIVFVTTTFLFNTTLMSFGTSVLTSTIYCISGHMLLMFAIPSLVFTFGSMKFVGEQLSNIENGIIGAGGILGKSFCIDSILNSAFTTIRVDDVVLSTENAILFSIVFAIEIGVGVFCFFLKEPSGEYYSMPGAVKERYMIILYSAIGVMYLVMAILEGVLAYSSLFAVIILMIFIVMTIYAYMSLVLFNKRFKLTTKELIIFGSIVLVAILFIFINYWRISDFLNNKTI